MALIGTLHLSGQSGQQYRFNVYPADTAFNTVPAVYAVSQRENNGNHNILYIGQTDNLPERFDNHHKLQCFQRQGFNAICVHQEPNERSRLSKESDLIAKYNPHCNG
jgi:predicted GIY-YIG superfamily endonuclease